MTVLWSTTELPASAFDPEPDDEDGPWCGSRTPGLLPEQHDRTVTVDVKGNLL